MPATSVRHVEKRRTGTCPFADRVAQISVDHYQCNIPKSFRTAQPQTCLATIVVFDNLTNHLQVVAMGVGTKFLSETVLKQPHVPYGQRVRDCHAEVLARRSFVKYVTEQIRLHQTTGSCWLLAPFNRNNNDGALLLTLKDNLTLHFYCSSTPCGNSTIKKFGTFQKEVYNDKLSQNEWPQQPHEAMFGHSISLGQFALLVKKDQSSTSATNAPSVRRPLTKKQKSWPIYSTQQWCPPGTATVWSHQGSLHTCSDKLARWNCLGLQGSLLNSLVGKLFLSTLTVGRKFSAETSRRAVCCRVGEAACHPAVMGTSVYMDEHGTIDGACSVRMHSNASWVAWLDSNDQTVVESIDGRTGLKTDSSQISAVSTLGLVKDFLELNKAARGNCTECPQSLQDLQRLKKQSSCHYEAEKEILLTTHPVLRDWRRRTDQDRRV